MEKIRAFPRLSLTCDIEYNYVSGGQEQNESVHSKTKDLSQGGICLITTTPLLRGSIIALKFKLQGAAKAIEVQGRVAWTQAFAIGNQMGYDNGIEFTKMSDEDKGIIEKFIKSMFPS